MGKKDSVNKDSARNMPHTGQLNKYAYAETTGTIRQCKKRTSDTSEHSSQTQNKKKYSYSEIGRRVRKPAVILLGHQNIHHVDIFRPTCYHIT